MTPAGSPVRCGSTGSGDRRERRDDATRHPTLDVVRACRSGPPAHAARSPRAHDRVCQSAAACRSRGRRTASTIGRQLVDLVERGQLHQPPLGVVAQPLDLGRLRDRLPHRPRRRPIARLTPAWWRPASESTTVRRRPRGLPNHARGRLVVVGPTSSGRTRCPACTSHLSGRSRPVPSRAVQWRDRGGPGRPAAAPPEKSRRTGTRC